MKRKAWLEDGTFPSEVYDEERGAGKVEGISPSGEAVYKGLCTTCNHRHGCAFRRVPGRPVLFCEEFDCSVATGTAVEDRADGAPTEERAAGTAHMEGLCATCEARATCRFPKVEGGVWYCEEFE